MDFKDFARISTRFWEERIAHGYRCYLDGSWNPGAYNVLFPNMAISTNCGDYFVFELAGAAREFQGLALKTGRSASIYKYVNQFEDRVDNYSFRFGKGCASNSGLAFAHEGNMEAVKKRFPIMEKFKTVFVRQGGSGSLFEFSDDFDACSFDHCLFVNRKFDFYRCKNVLTMFIVRRDISFATLKGYFEKFLRKNVPVHALLDESEATAVASQFQNFYLSPEIRETTIGDFLRRHPELICKSLSCQDFLYEKSFRWIKSKYPMDEESIRPDLLLKRCDGTYDICDLKTCAFSYKSITSKSSSRRRFIDYVHEGVAQLNTYREYFKIAENAKHALDVHGVVVDNPRLILIVGSWENVTPHEVEQASENYRNITVIDYDTLCQLYLAAH